MAKKKAAKVHHAHASVHHHAPDSHHSSHGTHVHHHHYPDGDGEYAGGDGHMDAQDVMGVHTPESAQKRPASPDYTMFKAQSSPIPLSTIMQGMKKGR